MSNINTLVLEVLAPGYSGYKRKEVGSGVGKFIGGTLAGPIGTVIGHAAGDSSIRNPEGKIDEKRPLHRMAVMHDKKNEYETG